MNINETPCPSDGDPRPTMLTQWRAEIINAVLRDGLQPSATLRESGKNYLGSSDENPCNAVYGWYFVPSITWKPSKPGSERYLIHRHDIQRALYATTNSILPVISERPQETPLVYFDQDKARRAFLERILSSLLIVCDDKSNYPDYPVRKSYMERRDHVLPSSFSYFVFPTDIWETYRNNSPEAQTCTIPVKTTNSVILKGFGLTPREREFKVVDYETPLQEIVNELRKPLWVHGIKLPTEEDLERLTQVPQEVG